MIEKLNEMRIYNWQNQWEIVAKINEIIDHLNESHKEGNLHMTLFHPDFGDKEVKD